MHMAPQLLAPIATQNSMMFSSIMTSSVHFSNGKCNWSMSVCLAAGCKISPKRQQTVHELQLLSMEKQLEHAHSTVNQQPNGAFTQLAAKEVHAFCPLPIVPEASQSINQQVSQSVPCGPMLTNQTQEGGKDTACTDSNNPTLPGPNPSIPTLPEHCSAQNSVHQACAVPSAIMCNALQALSPALRNTVLSVQHVVCWLKLGLSPKVLGESPIVVCCCFPFIVKVNVHQMFPWSDGCPGRRSCALK